MKEDSWTKYFIPPFHNDEICTDTIWDSAANRTTTSSSEAAFKGTADAHFKALAAAMNAKMNGTELPAKMSFGHPVYEGTMSDSIVRFKADGEEIELHVRGWGFLTGRKRLDPNVAAAIQDEYGQFIVDCMNSINSDAEAQMGELYDLEKLFGILHKEYGNYVVKETDKVKDWDTERHEEMEYERTSVRLCPAPGKKDTFGCTIADDVSITVNSRSVLWEDVNDADIAYLLDYVYKWLLRYAEDPEQIYSGYTPDKLLNWKELPYLPGISATALQQMRSSASFIIQNRSALREYFTEDEIAGTARFLDKLSHIYPIGT